MPAIQSVPLLLVLEHIKGAKAKHGYWIAKCPGHDDAVESLSITVGDDRRVLLKCHAGCTAEHIVQSAGLTMADLFPPREPSPYKPTKRRLVTQYDYHDEAGQLLFQSCRFDPKGFAQRKRNDVGEWTWSLNGTRLVPYHLPDVIQAVKQGRSVFVVEGEKDADLLRDMGYAATTNPMGAGKWRDEFSVFFRGGKAIVIPDNDEPGRAHAQSVAASLAAVGCTVRMVELPGLAEKGDVSDWFTSGHDDDELSELVGKARVWSPDPLAKTRWRLDELLANDIIMRPPWPVVPRLAWRSRSTLVAAREKLGKSTLAGYVAAQVTRGGMFLGDPCTQGDVLVVGLEEFLGDVARRLQHFGADPVRTHLLDRLPADPRERPQALRSHVDAVRPVLIVVDTLMAYSEGTVSDASSSSQMQPVVQSLTRLAHDSESAVIVVHHGRKADGTYRDSTAIGGSVDVIAEVSSHEDDTDPTLRRIKLRGRVPVQDFRFRYDGHAFHLDTGGKLPLEDRIIAIVRTRPGLSLRDLREAAEARAAEVDRVVMQMLAKQQIMDEGRGSSGRRFYLPVSRTFQGELSAPDMGRTQGDAHGTH